MDVSRAFTNERAETFRARTDDAAVVDSLVTVDEARRELDAMSEGTVGVRVGRTLGEAFLRRGNAYDTIAHDARDGWTIRKRCSGESLLFRADEEDAEIVILETVLR